MQQPPTDLLKYIEPFYTTPREGRGALMAQIVEETGLKKSYVKRKLYELLKRKYGSASAKAPTDASPANQILLDRTIIRERAAAREAQAKYKYLLREYELLEGQFNTMLAVREGPDDPIEIPIKAHDTGQHIACPIIALSDWHFEETVDPETINGLNNYNLEIAEARWFTCIQNAMRLVAMDRKHSTIDEAVVWLGGDFITGYIHEEMQQVNSLSPVMAIRFAKKHIIAALEFMLKHGRFTRITVVCNYGNHGRTDKKKIISVGYRNSYEWAMYCDIADYFAQKGEERIDMRIPRGFLEYAVILGYTWRFMHGDYIRYQGGIGGLTIPLVKALHRYDTQRYADYTILGHFHTRIMATARCYVNGSGIGYNAYAQSIGAPPEAPVQSYILVDQARGVTIMAPIFCG